MSRSLVAVLLSLVAATTIFAQPADVSAAVSVPERALAGSTIEWTATFTNHGPNAVTGARASADLGYGVTPPCLQDENVGLAVGESKTFRCTTTLPATAPPYGVTAVVGIGYGYDTNFTNNSAYALVRFISKPDLLVFFNAPGIPTPGLPFPIQVSVGNSAYTVAEDTRLTIDIPAAISIRTEAPGCSVAGTRVTCELGDLPEPEPNSGVSRNTVIALEIVAPEGSDVRFDATAEAFSPAGEETPANNRRTMSFRNYRTFSVTNTNDDGTGSLREAIHSANASCDADPCLIAFRIENAGPFASIQPGTPLPVLTAKNILLDGQTQHRYTNRTSELPRPLIELRGSRLTDGEGLVITTPCSLRVRGLAVNGFPGHALRISGRSEQCAAVFDSRVIERNYLGTDVTGRIAVPNLRGIYMDGHANPRIADNVISGNTRAGIFLAWGPHNVIIRNVIGLDATGTAALGNGASGIYVSAEAEGTDVFDNHIAFNGDAGVSVARNLRYVNVYRNAIHANRQLAIDYGLDGPTLEAPIPAVDVTSARYDAASNTTTIAVSRPLSNTSVDVYANDAPDPGGYGEAQYYLGTARHNGVTQRYELVHPGDLRGKWVAAQAIQIIITTFSTGPRAEAWGPYSNTTSSEMGRAVQVTQ